MFCSLDILITQLTTVDDVRSFIAGITHSSNQDQDEVRKWCVNQGDRQIMKILGSDEKTLPSFVQYGFVKGLPLLSGMLVSMRDLPPWLLTEQILHLASGRFRKTRRSASPSGPH